MMRRFCKPLWFVIVCVCITGSTAAQTIQLTGKNNSVDYTRLNRVDSLVNSYISKQWLTGAVTLVIKDNIVVQHKGYGVASRESGKPMQKDQLFRIMSQTKAITSVGVMILFEQGKLLLDEPISNYIAEFKNPVVISTFNEADTSFTTVPAKREITFRDLLTHTSGIDYGDIGTKTGRLLYAKYKIPTGLGHIEANLLDRMRALGKLPLIHQPGERFSYGLNTDLLGCLIELISGETLDDFLRKNIFEPLGMKDTYFTVPAAKAGRLAGVYTENENHTVIPWSHTFRGIDPDYPLMKTGYFSGGAGLTSTAMDYAIFMQMLLNGGIYNGHRILSPRTVQLMTTNQLKEGLYGDRRFGLGFDIVTASGVAKGPRNEGTFSWGGYYGTTYWADPKAKLVCLFMTQQTPNSHGDLEPRFENIVYSALK